MSTASPRVLIVDDDPVRVEAIRLAVLRVRPDAAVQGVGANLGAEAALSQSERRFRSFAEYAPVAMTLVRRDGTITFINRRFTQVLGYSAEDLPNLDAWWRLAYPDEAERRRVVESWETVSGGAVHAPDAVPPRERQVTCKDGSVRIVQFSSIALEEGILVCLVDLTEREQAERALRQREALMRDMGGMAHVGGWDFDPTTGDGHWTEEVALIHDLPPDTQPNKVLGLSFYRGESLARITEAVKRAIGQGTPYDLELELISATGRRKWVHTVGKTLMEGGRVVKVFGVIQDITERIEAQEKLRLERERLESIIGAASVGTWEWNIQTGQLEINDRWAAMLGYTPAELAPVAIDTWSRLIHPDDLRASDVLLQRHFRGELEFYSCEVRLRHRNGGWVWVADRGRVTARTTDGQPLLMQGTHMDITQRKLAEIALQEREQQLRQFVEHSPAAIAMLDLEMRYVVVSQRWRSDFQLGDRDIIGLSHYEVFPEIPERWRAIHRRCLAGAIERCELDPFLRPDGHTDWVRWEVRPWYRAQGSIGGISIFSEVVTEKVALEAQLRQSQKLEAVGQLAGGVAHDFNNILSAMLLQIGLLQTQPTLDAEMRGALADLESEARRAANLTRQLLMFSRRAVLETKPLDLDEVVENLMKMLRRLIGENIRLQFSPKAALPRIQADAGMLEQVVVNLVVNARDAMPRGGVIAVENVAEEFRQEDLSEGSLRRPGRFVCLTVTDTGCGMDAETLRRIFDPFFTTKEPGKGTGLGLATVHGIVAQHKGWVEVDSAVAKGSTFRVFLPALERAREEALAEQRPQSRPPGGSETILLVEDQPKVRRMLALALRKQGYVVLEASNGQEAIDAWQEHGPEIDLLFTDMIMPEGITGLELTERLRRLKPRLRAIISSGYSAEIAEKAAIESAGIVYLPKPCEAQVIAATVRRCLDGTFKAR